MEKDQLTTRKDNEAKISTWLEKLSKKNIMNWGVLELAESVQQRETRNK